MVTQYNLEIENFWEYESINYKMMERHDDIGNVKDTPNHSQELKNYNFTESHIDPPKGNNTRNTIHLTFRNLTYSIKDREVLKGVSGEACPGELLVIMGPSGGGKSTLLNALSGKLKGGTFAGNILVNGTPTTKIHNKNLVYIEQTEIINPVLSVRESLTYASQLVINGTEIERESRVNAAITRFGLERCQHTPVGSVTGSAYGAEFKGLSGGERRRAYIAIETLSNPPLLILDEPTTGLDSENAESVLAYIKSMAKQMNCTVIMTIHQPSSAMYAMFDKLLLLVDGRVAYYGSAGAEAIEFFEKANMPCPPNFNPADHFIHQVSNDDKAAILVEQQKELWHVNDKSDIEKGDHANTLFMDNLHVKPEKYRASYYEQFLILLQRSLLVSWRAFNPKAIALILFLSIFIGLCGVNGRNANFSLTDKRVLIENAILFLGFIYSVGFMPTINRIINLQCERKVLAKEYQAGSYNLLIHYIADNLGKFPVSLIMPLCYSIVVYFIVGFRIDQWMLAHFALIIVCTIIASNFGVIYAALTNNEQLAMLLQAVVAVVCLMTTGFYIPVELLPVWLRWLQWANSYYYGYDALIRIEYTGREIEHIPSVGFLSAANIAKLGNATHYGSDILFNQLDVKLSLMQDFGALLGFTAASYIIAFVLVSVMVVRR